MQVTKKGLTVVLVVIAVAGLTVNAVAGGAREGEQVILITPAPVDEIEMQIEAFNEIYPEITVETLFMGVGEIQSRLQAESGNPQTDVVSDAPVSYINQNPELFRPHVSEHDDAFSPQTKDGDNLWYGHYGGPQVIFVNTDTLPNEEDWPTTWAELADPKYEGELIMANPALSSSAFSQLYIMLEVGGWDLVEDIVANATVTPSSRLAWQGVADGEFGVGMVTESTGVNLLYEEYPIELFYPEDGTNQMLTGLALVANSPNPDNAVKLFEFLNSREAHQMVADEPYFRRSARPDVETHDFMKAEDEIKYVINVEEMTQIPSEERERILERFEEIMADVGVDTYE